MNTSVHYLRVQLRHVKPAVRRDLVVPSNLRLDRLHEVLQIAMGWEGVHLHEFIVGSLRDGEHFGPAGTGADDFDGPRVRDEKRCTLQQIAPRKGSKFLYSYDFGDDWHHLVTVKAVGMSRPGETTLECLDGVGACPPEDCGGPFGYANLLDTLANPADEDHDDMRDWVGDGFDPARFDIDVVNETLTRQALRWLRPARKSATTR